MKQAFLLIVFILSVSAVHSQKGTELNRPKLFVGIVIDQMRWDYLYRYYNRFEDGGFKRMMNEGFNCQNTMINYLPTFTAPGHACAYTGSVPSIHGIASNDWIDKATGESVYCTEDKKMSAVGGASKAGKMSPENLWVTTVTDELRLATNMRAKVYGISIKDRGSILPAGYLANGAYWFDDSTGGFMSSTYYGNELPAWLTAFNSQHYADSLINKDWELLYPANTYKQSLADANAYEGKFKGEDAPVFPHSVKGIKGKGYNGLRYLPGGNTIVLKAARACIKGAELGQGSATDFLCVSLSTPDYAGHMFTSNSMEAEDMYLRLDKELASFLRYLDNHIGKGNYTVFLTADHGAAHNTQYLKDLKIPAGNKSESKTINELNVYLETKTSTKDVVKQLGDYQVYLDESKIKNEADRNIIKQLVVDWLNKQEGIAYAIDMDRMNNANIPEPIKTMIVNGYNRERSGSIQIILKPGWYGDSHTTGTTHGTWNPYDTHIPLLWYGWGIKNGETHRTVNMTDIAPTISALLHIQMPNGCVGNVITELVD